jgi:hypothetical protein
MSTALIQINYARDLIGKANRANHTEVSKELGLMWRYIASPSYGTRIDNSGAKFWRQSDRDFSWPNKKASDKSTKSPTPILIKTSQAVIDDIILRYKQDKKGRVANRVKQTSERAITKGADGKTEIVIGFQLPASEGFQSQKRKSDPIQTHVQLVKFMKTGKVMTSTGGKVSESTMTRIQEIGTARVLRHAMKGSNHDLTTAAKIRADDVVMDNLREVFKRIGDIDEVDDDWLHNFAAQNRIVLEKIKRRDFQHFNREGGFMDFISDLLRKKFKIHPKDNWNPADIWLIHNETQKMNFIKDAMKAPKEGDVIKGRWRVSAKLNQLNKIFRDWFKSEELMGLSLKKVTAKDALWKVYNTNDDFFNDIGSKFMSFESAQCFMDLETKKGVRTFASQDTRLLVRDGPKGGQGTIYDFQIKANSSSKLDNLKYEPTQHGASAARMGKATVEYVENLLKLYVGDKFKKSNSDPEYARNADTFADQKTKWVNRIDNLISKGVTVQSDKYNGTKLDGEACYDKIMTVFGTQYWVANSKLMQISWLSLVMSLQGNNTDSNAGDQLDEFCTDMVYLASKAGPRYGPFAKVF